MRGPDLDKEHSEKLRTQKEFLTIYNKDLPAALPRVSTALLNEFRTTHLDAFKVADMWSLDQHRKKVMDWLAPRPRAMD